MTAVAATTEGVGRVLTSRAIRGFADGFVSVLLAQYLDAIGFSAFEIGAIVTGTLLGSAALTLAFGLTAHRYRLRTLLLAASALMAATGLGFMSFTWFWALLVVAVLGTLNPSGGDVSVFLPAEQAYVAEMVPAPRRPHVFARYNVAAAWPAACGALASGLPVVLARWASWDEELAQRLSFGIYVAAGIATLVVYLHLTTPGDRAPSELRTPPRAGLRTSRRIVLELSALFSLDAAGGGFVVTSLLVLWLHLRFDLSAGVTGAVFFAAGVLGGCSQFLAPWLAARVGLIRTMVFTHMPANVLLAGTAFAPNAAIAVAMLLVRALLSQMDVPARQSFVMAVVPPEERAAAASVTNVPRSLAAATTPLLAGLLLDRTTFGWPLVIAGTVKFVYDGLLLFLYHDVPEETGAERARRSR